MHQRVLPFNVSRHLRVYSSRFRSSRRNKPLSPAEQVKKRHAYFSGILRTRIKRTALFLFDLMEDEIARGMDGNSGLHILEKARSVLKNNPGFHSPADKSLRLFASRLQYDLGQWRATHATLSRNPDEYIRVHRLSAAQAKRFRAFLHDFGNVLGVRLVLADLLMSTIGDNKT